MNGTDEQNELLTLLGRLVDGELTDSEREQLTQRLDGDAAARQQYLQYIDAHARLLLHYEPVTASDDGHTVGSDSVVASAVIIDVKPTALSRRIKRYDSIHWQRHKIRFNAMTAVLTALAWVGFSYFVWSTTTPDNSRPNRDGINVNFVAQITGRFEHGWADGMREMPPNAFLVPGEELNLVEGLIEITFFDGAKVVLEGPAEFVIDSSGAGTLELGRLTANVSQEAIGFVIDTPSMQLIDLGTEFGVSVAKSGNVEAHVFVGSVECSVKLSNGNYGNPKLLTAGRAIRVYPGSHPTEYISVNPNEFTVGAAVADSAIVSFTETLIQSSDGSVGNGILGGPRGLIRALDFGRSVGNPNDLGVADQVIDITDGTVTFTNYSALGDDRGRNGRLTGSKGASLLGDSDLNKMLNNNSYGIAGTGVTVAGLIPGRNYRLQILSYVRNFSHPTDVSIDGQRYLDWETFVDNNTNANMLTAEWTQSPGRTSVYIMFGGSDPCVSGLILHETEAVKE